MPKLNRVTRHGSEGIYGYTFFCPGCREVHFVVIDTTERVHWTFNGDEDRPTFSPSLLRYANKITPRCHSYVRDGKIQFLGDCDHALAGQTVELPEWKGWDADLYG